MQYSSSSFSLQCFPKKEVVRNLIISAMVLLLFSSCERSAKQVATFNRDTDLQNYLLVLDSLPYYDTTDLNYKALKAYQKNDSNFFIEFAEEKKRKQEFLKQWANSDTCVKLKPLDSLGVDQAYRFKFISAFCSMPIIATVTKKGEEVNLHFIVYQSQYDTVRCEMINEINKKLTLDNWEDFSMKLMQADIWGLKRDNGISGLDGSTMTFTAFENIPNTSRPPRQCFVERWSYSTLKEPFDYIVKLSGNTKGCFWIQ